MEPVAGGENVPMEDSTPVEKEPMSRKEFDTLCYLAEHAGSVVSKQELMTAVWKQPYLGSEKTIDTHVSWLRNKLGESASAPRYLHTVRGVGLKLAGPD